MRDIELMARTRRASIMPLIGAAAFAAARCRALAENFTPESRVLDSPVYFAHEKPAAAILGTGFVGVRLLAGHYALKRDKLDAERLTARLAILCHRAISHVASEFNAARRRSFRAARASRGQLRRRYRSFRRHTIRDFPSSRSH